MRPSCSFNGADGENVCMPPLGDPTIGSAITPFIRSVELNQHDFRPITSDFRVVKTPRCTMLARLHDVLHHTSPLRGFVCAKVLTNIKMRSKCSHSADKMRVSDLRQLCMGGPHIPPRVSEIQTLSGRRSSSRTILTPDARSRDEEFSNSDPHRGIGHYVSH